MRQRWAGGGVDVTAQAITEQLPGGDLMHDFLNIKKRKRENKMRILARLGRLIIGAAGLVAAGAASAQQLQEVTIGLSSTSFGAAGYRLAKELDLFKKNGLNPELSCWIAETPVVTALISGSIHISLAEWPTWWRHRREASQSSPQRTLMPDRPERWSSQNRWPTSSAIKPDSPVNDRLRRSTA